jgi:excisionase family DNA binding protein
MSIAERLLKMKEVAGMLNVAYPTLWLWVKEGRIKAVRLPSKPGAKKVGIRIPASEVARILQGKATS